jgi:hypothetical protein
MQLCGIYSVLVSTNLIFFGHVLAEITSTERPGELDVGIETYEQRWPWECEVFKSVCSLKYAIL